MSQLQCLACILEADNAQWAARTDPDHVAVVVPIRPAVTIVNGQASCREHLIIQRPSALAAPNGAPLLLPGH